MFVFGDFNVHHKDWLTCCGGTDRPGELCHNFSVSDDLTQMINHSWNPPTPLLKGGGRTFQKLSHLGITKSFARKGGDKPVKGGGGFPLFLLLYSSIIFTVSGGEVRFPLLLRIFSFLS